MQDRRDNKIGVKTNALIPLISELKNANRPNRIKDKEIKSNLILFLEKISTIDIDNTVPIVNSQVTIVSLRINERAGIEKNERPNNNTETILKIITKYDSEFVKSLIFLNIDFKVLFFLSSF